MLLLLLPVSAGQSKLEFDHVCASQTRCLCTPAVGRRAHLDLVRVQLRAHEDRLALASL